MTNLPTTPDNLPVPTKPPAAELAIPEQATGEVVSIELDAHSARVLTDDIRGLLGTAYKKLITAYHGRAWTWLGYETWDAYCKAEFKDAGMVRLDPNQRREVVAELREAGMSTRAISSGLGVSVGTVHTDIDCSELNSRPATVISLDGRERPAKRPPRATSNTAADTASPQPVRQKDHEAAAVARPPARRQTQKEKRSPLTKAYKDSLLEIKVALDELEKLHGDDRFKASRKALVKNGCPRRLALIIKKMSECREEICGESAPERPLLANSQEARRLADEALRLVREGALEAAPAEVRAEIVATYRRAGDLFARAAEFGETTDEGTDLQSGQEEE